MAHRSCVWINENAQCHGQENEESIKRDNAGLLALESISRWDVSGWSSLDEALYSNYPLELVPDTGLGSKEGLGKLVMNIYGDCRPCF
jgi:hypothetical protein